ncbi:MAG TPA: thioredoxin [Candidatus Bipolaricaulota bacterium]|nr:thioredoxin [Candidatus Bipolaricaulota bacterium]
MEKHFTDVNFEDEVLKYEGPVLVDFFAEWCGPCKMQGPIIDELEQEMDGKAVKIGKMDVDANPKTAEKYGIMSIPTLMIFVNGEVKETMNGVHNKEDLKGKLQSLLK